jgi:hypothetical protein
MQRRKEECASGHETEAREARTGMDFLLGDFVFIDSFPFLFSPKVSRKFHDFFGDILRTKTAWKTAEISSGRPERYARFSSNF